jgi:hypothetical protein
MSDIQLELEKLTADYLKSVFELNEDCQDDNLYDQIDSFICKIEEMLTEIEF